MIKSSAKIFHKKLLNLLADAKTIKSLPQRRLWVLAIITEALKEKNIRPVLIGGGAVEYYTFGGYATEDMDLAVSDFSSLNAVLKKMRFKKEGRYWYREDLGILIEAPAGDLRAQGETAPLSEVRIRKMSCYVIGIEDLIIDRLNGFIHWKQEDDYRWAKEIALNYKNMLDWEYLKRRGRQEKILKAIGKLRREVKGAAKKGG